MVVLIQAHSFLPFKKSFLKTSKYIVIFTTEHPGSWTLEGTQKDIIGHLFSKDAFEEISFTALTLESFHLSPGYIQLYPMKFIATLAPLLLF